MLIILIFDTAVICIVSIILSRNYFTFESIRAKDSLLQNSPKAERDVKVSVCIPVRNEANTIRKCVESIIVQDYPNLEICVLNDQSTDETPTILEELKSNYPERLHIFQGEQKPDDWLGKPWACHQLSLVAQGEILIFLDADVWMESNIVSATVHRFNEYQLDGLSVWPQQIMRNFWEKVLIPMLYYVLLGFLVTDYVTQTPKWLPAYFRSRLSTLFAAANGQFMAFTKSAYEQIGGHQSVKNEIVEDVELSRQIKKTGLKLRLFHGVGGVYCRMYANKSEILEGFRKNFLAGFRFNIILFSAAAIFHIMVYVLPYITLIISIFWDRLLILALSLLVILITIFQRLFLAKWFKWDLIYSFTHLIGVLWFQYLGILSISDFLMNRKVKWKDRPITIKKPGL